MVRSPPPEGSVVAVPVDGNVRGGKEDAFKSGLGLQPRANLANWITLAYRARISSWRSWIVLALAASDDIWVSRNILARISALLILIPVPFIQNTFQGQSLSGPFLAGLSQQVHDFFARWLPLAWRVK